MGAGIAPAPLRQVVLGKRAACAARVLAGKCPPVVVLASREEAVPFVLVPDVAPQAMTVGARAAALDATATPPLLPNLRLRNQQVWGLLQLFEEEAA